MNSDTKSISDASDNAVGPTPGPWEACGNLVRDTRDADGNGGFLIAECIRFGDKGHEENRGNARLIAAAPDLLAALAEAREYLSCIPESAVGGDDEAGQIVRVCNAAITKAEGR